ADGDRLIGARELATHVGAFQREQIWVLGIFWRHRRRHPTNQDSFPKLYHKPGHVPAPLRCAVDERKGDRGGFEAGTVPFPEGSKRLESEAMYRKKTISL